MKTIVYIRSTDIYYDSRATKEIKAFLEAGYRIIVFGWNRTGCAEKKCREAFRSYSSVTFLFYEQYMPHGIGMKNIGKLAGWFRWIRKTLKTINSIDSIHACDLDGAIGAGRYSKKRHIKLVYDIYDYYTDTHNNIPSALKNIIEKLEIRIINRADLVIICTEERKAQISKAHPKRTIVVHNSPDLDSIPDSENRFDYVYCGNLGEERLFADILKEYENNADLKFYLAGPGTYSCKAEEMSKMFDNLSYGGLLNYDQVLETEAKATCLSAVYDPSWKNHQLCAPNKFYESLALGKPVIVCRGTGIDRIVEANSIGRVIDYQAKQFYQAIRYYKDHPEECDRIRTEARALYEQRYQWKVMQERLLEAYRDL